ncbi:D-alanyl-D-alanine carboxypeptidase [Microbacterium pseudoresistens]|uniref:D-alanyl-D-alanine carboxypeptidase n=1 Tax=Microbacterium pseudoresistens TaxID=640634 RepID=A0A7Y9EW49_9MICO|nr:D-alanyl-D-alanine carboxypeptidase [Microbacterium pseudoresistens]
MHASSSRRARRAAAAAVALALLLSGCTAEAAPAFTPKAQTEADLPADVQGQLQGVVEKAMAATGSSGAIVGVWVPWSGTWVAGLGTSDGSTPVTTDMAFRIGDVTRLMTCDVLYALADREIVSLDDPVTKYVNGVADLTSVSLLDLCNGAAGLGSSEPTLRPGWLTNPNRVWSAKEEASYGLERARVAPGTEYRDSDAGYLILGEALERATDKSAAELIRTYVTAPLGLDDTQLPSRAPAAPSTGPVLNGTYLPPGPEGAGLDCTAPIDVTVSSSSIGFTDSGVVSTIDDLGLYLQAEAAQALRIKDKPARFGSPLPAAADAPSWYQATGGAFLLGTMIGQHGWAPGYLTAGYSDPETGLTVAVVLNNANDMNGLVDLLARQLAAIASKAPAADGATAPEFALPFTAEQYDELITANAVCPLPQPEAEVPADEGEPASDEG